MSSHSSMLRASAAMSGASPPVPTTRGAKSTSALIRPTMASTRPAYPNTSPDCMLVMVLRPIAAGGRAISTRGSFAVAW